MEYVVLGRTDLHVSRLCFGCATMGGYDYGPADDAVSVAAVRRALELGVNFFDVADVYGLGRAETVLRRALGSRLHDVVVATKFGVTWAPDGRTGLDLSPAYMRQALENSLRRLGVEAISLYQIHKPDGQTLWEDCMAALEQCRTEGKIRHIGASNIETADVDSCQAAGRLDSLQMPFSLADQQHASSMIDAQTRWGMSALAYNVLAHGLFSGRHSRDAVFSGTDLRTRIPMFQAPLREQAFGLLDRITRVAKVSGRSYVQVAIAWALHHPAVSVALVGTRTPAQIAESVGALGWPWLDSYAQLLDTPGLNPR